MTLPLTLADGQLPAAAVALYTATEPVRVNLTCSNTSASLTETVIITILRGASTTARRICRCVLSPNEQLYVFGVPLQANDVLQGSTSDATTVDYVVTVGGAGQYSIVVLDSTGAVKTKNVPSLNNTTAVTDPGVSNDSSQGYAVGSIWINTSASRVWMCQSAAVGAAVWLFDGVVPGTGIEPASMLTQFGGIAAAGSFPAMREEGNFYRNNSASIAGNGADATDDILWGMALDANAFDINGRGMSLTINGNFAANGNNKRVKLWVNPTMVGQTVTAGVISGGTVSGVGSGILLYDSGVQTGNNVGWNIGLLYYKYGIAGSNTQNYNVQPIFGNTHGGVTKTLQAAMAENAIMNFVVTGSSPTSSAANDVVLDLVAANGLN